MNIFKKWLSKKKQYASTESFNSFEEKLEKSIIPSVWDMAVKEYDHLDWLIKHKAPSKLINKSRLYLAHLHFRHKSYLEFVSEHKKNMNQ